MQLVEGLEVAERFRLVRELGRGGMGSVWLAEHIGLEVLCAIKFIDKEGQNSPEALQRFQREAKAAAQLRSPHVVQVFDHGEWEGVPYIAMEYLEGEDLSHRLDRVGRLSWGETSRIATQVARALGKAHAAGIVHRDMKPENIFLAKDDETETAKVLDFGIAKSSKTKLSDVSTKTGALLGTPFYMSPEQARGTKTVDYRSDLFSLSVIVYQCMTGELPFYSEGLGDILGQIMYEAIPVPSEKASDIPPAFDVWWKRAAAREPDERFQSAKELAEALAIALGVSDAADITFASRAEGASTPDHDDTTGSIPRLRVPPTAPTLMQGVTTEEPFERTVKPSVPAGRNKRTALAFAIILMVGLSAFAFVRSRSSSGRSIAESQVPENVVTQGVAAATPAPELAAAAAAFTVSPLPTSAPAASVPVAPATVAPAPIVEKSAQVPVSSSASPRAPLIRKAKPAKRRDYGI